MKRAELQTRLKRLLGSNLIEMRPRTSDAILLSIDDPQLNAHVGLAIDKAIRLGIQPQTFLDFIAMQVEMRTQYDARRKQRDRWEDTAVTAATGVTPQSLA